ncbi:Protein phosphatase 2C domain-containing protein [Rhodovastum atsumiense]|nr:Protein phosphatase 2C domain-containing protein [Rhodovastum atsumiense]
MVKPRNDSFTHGQNTVWRQNEDRFRLSSGKHGMLAAVADGAGGSGLFCGPWAETLLTRLPDQPLTGIAALNQWLEGFCLEFQRSFSERAKAEPRKHSKFMREGSFATLTACWLEESDQHGVSCRWTVYGDSPMLVFDRTGPGWALLVGHPGSLRAFDQDPSLLSWKMLPTAAALRSGSLQLPARATVVLATDGVGQFLFLRYLAALDRGLAGATLSEPAAALLDEFRSLRTSPGSRVGAAIGRHLARSVPSFAEEMDTLADSLASEAGFAAVVAARHGEGVLADDDSTLIMIDIAPSDPSSGSGAGEGL